MPSTRDEGVQYAVTNSFAPYARVEVLHMARAA